MKINSFIHACKILGRDPVKSRPKVSGLPKRDQKAVVAFAEYSAICQASWSDHPEWKKRGPDWNNTSQAKWRPWMDMDKPGFRFDESGCTSAASCSTGGSRHVFATREESDWHAKKHIRLLKDMMVIPR